MPLKDEAGCTIGYEYMGQKYHLHDFVLYYGETNSANVGYVTGVHPTPPPKETYGFITILKVGRMVDLSHLAPTSCLKDEVCKPQLVLIL